MASPHETGSAEEQQALAQQLVERFPRPEQVSSVKVHLGPDYQGIASLWHEVYVRPDLEAKKHDLQILTRFTNDLQEYLLRNGVSLFAYGTLEHVA